MSRAGKTLRLVFFLLAPLCAELFSGIAAAQENYPVPQGNPEDWGVPGRVHTLSEESSPPESGDLLSAPGQRVNADRNRPDVPWGEAQEGYTGTKPFGGKAGTGITDYGTESR